MDRKNNFIWWLIAMLAIIKFILPFLVQSPVYEMQRDEYLYYQQGQHLAMGYFENPPLLAWLAKISSWLGGSVFWIKFWPSLFGSLTLIVACLITIEWGGKRFAILLTALGVMTGAYMRVHALFQPNFLDIFFWTLSIYFIIRYIKTNRNLFIYLFAIAIALGFLGKYSILFFASALIVSLIISQHRNLFTRSVFYKAVLIAILIITPNIIWQQLHNWPLIHHMKELQETQLKYMNPVGFLSDQFMMLIATSLVWIGGIIWLFRNKQWRFLVFTFFLILLLLILGRGKSYYSLGIYPMLMAAGAILWEQWTAKRKWIRYVLSILIIGFTYVILPMLLPIWEPGKLAKFYKDNGLKHKWEDQKNHELPQDFADMLGWKEITQKTESFYQTLPDSTQASTIIFGRHYGHVGSMKFYSKNKSFSDKVYTDNGSFLLWIPENFQFTNIILVARRMPGADDEVFQHFEKVTVIDSVSNSISRQYGDKIVFFENIDPAGLKIAQDGLKEMKKQFGQ